MIMYNCHLDIKVCSGSLPVNIKMASSPQSCDTFVALPPATADGCIIFGKNSDRPDDEVQEVVYYPSKDYDAGSKVMCTYIEIDQAPKTHAVILSKPAWMWGAEMGANEHSVCIGNEAVWTKLNSDDDLTERLLGMDMVRLVLERVKSSKEGVVLIGELLTRYGQGGSCYESKAPSAYHNSFIVVDRTEAWVVETAGRFWAAELVKEGVRNISNQLSIGTKIDMMSPSLVEEAKSLGLYSDTGGTFNFTKTFSDDVALDRRYVCGRRMLQQYSKQGKFGMNDMIKILRDEDSGICMTGGYTSTGSQVSVIPTGTSTSPPIHWLTATPNPVISIYKPFMFCVDVDIGDITQSPHYGDSDPLRTKPRFQTVVDRKHALYEGHDNLVKLLNKKKSVGARIAEKAREIENKCITQLNEKMDKQDYSNMSEIFKHACIEELGLYNTD